jgi:hypothetical protein
MVLLTFVLVTRSNAWAPPRHAATAQQVQAARAVFEVVRDSRATGRPIKLVLGAADLDSLSAMVTQGFKPKRLDMRLSNGVLVTTVSQPLLGRWLNIRGSVAAQSKGFPPVLLEIGAVRLPPWLTHVALQTARRLLTLRSVELPDLDEMIQSFSVAENHVQARIFLPKTALLDQVLADPTLKIADTSVAKIYCELAAKQSSDPDPLFSHQLHRALAAAGPARAEHGAALVALAMLATDPKVGELVGETSAKVRACLIPSPTLTLQGRSDSPKHWSLSAVLTVVAGGRLAVAMGEWKELSDSLSQSAYLAKNDRSGFSFVDLAADRAGFLAARQLTSVSTWRAARARLLNASDEDLLPASATRLDDGMTNSEFVRKFGAADDPKFLSALEAIDADLRRVGLE